MSIKKIGDWQKAMALAGAMAEEMERARKQSLQQYGLKTEAIAKAHITNQDLNWVQLKPATFLRKIKKGYSDSILVETSSYFQSITSWVTDGQALVGVKRTATNADGENIADIAKVHEYGAGSTPARPLWQPTFQESLEWFWRSNSTPVAIFKNNIRRYL